MSSKNHRSGGKFCGSHTTIITAALSIVDVAAKQTEVSKIALCLVETGLHATRGMRRVKFEVDNGSILLHIRGTICCQEIRVYSEDVLGTQLDLAKFARSRGYHISFHEGNKKRSKMLK